MHETDERELLSLENAGLLDSAVTDLTLYTCTVGKRRTVVAAMVSCFHHGYRYGDRHGDR